MNKTNFYEDIVNLGEAVKILRNRRKITQDILASKAGVSKKYLRAVEQGKHSVGLEVTLKLCDALNVNRFELFTLAWENEYKAFLK